MKELQCIAETDRAGIDWFERLLDECPCGYNDCNACECFFCIVKENENRYVICTYGEGIQ